MTQGSAPLPRTSVRCRTVETTAVGYGVLSSPSHTPTDKLLSLEIAMTQRTRHPPSTPGPVHPRPPEDPKRAAKPTEPAEVLGRHENSGQKDHKGAR